MSDWNDFFSYGIFRARAGTYCIYKEIQAYDLANRTTLNHIHISQTFFFFFFMAIESDHSPILSLTASGSSDLSLPYIISQIRGSLIKLS